MFSLGRDSLFLDVWRPPEAFFAFGLSFVAGRYILGGSFIGSQVPKLRWNQRSAEGLVAARMGGGQQNGRDQSAACERLLFNLYSVPRWSQSWDQSRKWKHMAGVSRITGPPRTLQRKGKKGNGNLWEESNWINRVLRSPAPYYPIIYIAWGLGNASCWRRPSVFHRKVAFHASHQSKVQAL